jgi:hypothetical protein
MLQCTAFAVGSSTLQPTLSSPNVLQVSQKRTNLPGLRATRGRGRGRGPPGGYYPPPGYYGGGRGGGGYYAPVPYVPRGRGGYPG